MFTQHLIIHIVAIHQLTKHTLLIHTVTQSVIKRFNLRTICHTITNQTQNFIYFIVFL